MTLVGRPLSPPMMALVLLAMCTVCQVHGRDTQADNNGHHSSSTIAENRGLSKAFFFPSSEAQSEFFSRGKLMASSRTGNDQDGTAEKYSTQKKESSLLKFVKKKGRVTLNLTPKSSAHGHKRSRRTRSISTSTRSHHHHHKSTSKDKETVSISMDPLASLRLVRILWVAGSSLLAAFVGTLKLLGPLIFARRVLAQVGELVSDYMMGRYLRTTYDHYDRKYWRKYQGPAAARSLGRCFAHMAILLQLGYFMEKWLSLQSPPCVISGTGACHWWCGLLWILSVIGTGNIGAVLIATRGPLKIKVRKSATANPSKRKKFPLVNPGKLLQWMKDPDRVLTNFATSRLDNSRSWKLFTPEPLLFPSTFPLFSIARNVAVAKAMATSATGSFANSKAMATSTSSLANSRHIIMRSFLIQHAFMDEWHRVLMEERRVGLGVFAIGVGFIATSSLFVTVALVDRVSAVLMLPWLVATFSSGWMTLFCYWERRRDREKRRLIVAPVLANNGRHRRSIGGAKKYEIKW